MGILNIGDAGDVRVRDLGEPGDVLDTCFALLFLKKSTIPVGVVLSR